MPRFFTDNVNSEIGIVTGDDRKHIEKSLRMKIGDEIVLCNQTGQDYFGNIDSISESEVTVKIYNVLPSKGESPVNINLIMANPKGDKMDLIVQKCTELGVKEITPMLTQYCVSRPDQKSMKKKIDRWQKIAEEASKQSGRGIIPKINQCVEFKEIVNNMPNESLNLICYEKYGTTIKETIKDDSNQKINLIIGSEGGFSDKEIEEIKNNNINIITLGDRILRCETAPISAISIIMALKDCM